MAKNLLNEIKRRRGALGGIALAMLLAGCGTGGDGPSFGSGPSLGDRFSQLFGGKSQAIGEAPPPPEANEPTCPSVLIRNGASTYPVGLPGQEASGASLRYQGTITRTARDCVLSGGQVNVRLGIQGRVIVGPAGAPPTVELPLRVAVVQEGISPKTIFTNVYRASVAINPEGNAVYSVVAEDISYPAPFGAEGDSYVFYVGFDPQAGRSEARGRGRRR